MQRFRIVRVLVLLVAGVAAGLAWNTFGGRGIPLRANAFLREGGEVVDVAEAKKRHDGGALFLDARPVDYYRMSHIPGALPLPEDDFDASFAKIEPTLRKRFDLVLYCSGFGCEASHIVAEKLRARGIHAAILHEGWPAWNDAGLPIKEGDAP